ncbi:DUF1684 domain-containing protein [Streptomyces sp. DSM 44915]|uniref:DUF1684 domain-containing protein n=1 Tax=Streptomyces chisholmiae TaxID=3075540 RepID=A0ABU2JNP9_9ACTN|nr:DUF1684 domain-containing protein [Streptomyces sp. DSM 44915]MDT0266621.1 DUF1684 domain-containing protein [Streptomyces sp. DSM 44915]
MPETPVTDAGFLADWRRWRAAREAALRDPHGFLAVTGLHWLTPEPTRYPDAPGSWWADEEHGVLVELTDGEELRLAGRRRTGRLVVGRLEAGPWRAAFGAALLEVAVRGGQFLLRPRHPDHPARTGYAGTPTHRPDPAWVRPGRFLPFAEPRAVTVPAVLPGLEHVYQAPGQVEFELGGARHRLTAFNGAGAGLTVLFTDTTSGASGHRPGRVLALPAPADDGRLTVDLNRATNPPCAYTEFATCPLPPPENRLPVAVAAGERPPG